MWSSTTITSSAWPSHWLAKMPIVAEPQPTRMRRSAHARRRSAAGRTGRPRDAPPSMVSSTASALASAQHRFTRNHALFLAAAGQVMHAAQAKHLAAVFGGGDMADRLARWPAPARFQARDGGRCRSSPSGRNSENTPSDTTVTMSTPSISDRDDERRRLVVRIGRSGADGGDEQVLGRRSDCRTSPRRRSAPAPGERTATVNGSMRVSAPVDVAVAVAGAGLARPNAAQHRAGVAGDDARLDGFGGQQRGFLGRIGGRHGCWSCPRPLACNAASTRSGVAGTLGQAHAGRRARWHSGSPARSRSAPVRPRPWRRTDPADRGARSGSFQSAGCRRWSGSGSRAGYRCGRARIPPSAPGRGPGRCRHGSAPRPAAG